MWKQVSKKYKGGICCEQSIYQPPWHPQVKNSKYLGTVNIPKSEEQQVFKDSQYTHK